MEKFTRKDGIKLFNIFLGSIVVAGIILALSCTLVAGIVWGMFAISAYFGWGTSCTVALATGATVLTGINLYIRSLKRK